VTTCDFSCTTETAAAAAAGDVVVTARICCCCLVLYECDDTGGSWYTLARASASARNADRSRWDLGSLGRGTCREAGCDASLGGGVVPVKTCLLTTRVALPTETGTDSQGPLLFAKGSPTSSRGYYQVVPIEHHVHTVHLMQQAHHSRCLHRTCNLVGLLSSGGLSTHRVVEHQSEPIGALQGRLAARLQSGETEPLRLVIYTVAWWTVQKIDQNLTSTLVLADTTRSPEHQTQQPVPQLSSPLSEPGALVSTAAAPASCTCTSTPARHGPLHPGAAAACMSQQRPQAAAARQTLLLDARAQSRRGLLVQFSGFVGVDHPAEC
jgi:hypothetical protein